MDTQFCSQHAQANQLPLYGTSSFAETWVALEYNGAWEAKALQDNELRPQVNQWLSRQIEQSENGRALFIRDRFAVADTLLIARTTASDQRLYRVPLGGYEDVTFFDSAEILANNTSFKPENAQVVLVCTNGKRDQCCAKFGQPIFEAFAQETILPTYACTHLGGHVYAPTLAVLPAGIYYGYVNPTDVNTVADSILQRQISLAHYRGRTFQSPTVNAADYYVRQQTGLLGFDEFTLAGVGKKDAETFIVRFIDSNSAAHCITLRAWQSEPIVVGCSGKTKPQPRFQLLDYQH